MFPFYMGYLAANPFHLSPLYVLLVFVLSFCVPFYNQLFLSLSRSFSLLFF
jgi:hypothetical protein